MVEMKIRLGRREDKNSNEKEEREGRERKGNLDVRRRIRVRRRVVVMKEGKKKRCKYKKGEIKKRNER